MRRIAAVALGTALGAGCGGECESVIPSKELTYLGPLKSAVPGEVGLRAFRALTLASANVTVPMVGGDPVIVRVALPAKHCAGELALRVAQSVGPSDVPQDQMLSIFRGKSASGTAIGTSEALRATDDAVSLDTYAELADEKRLGPSATDHAIVFAVPEGVDAVTLVRTSAAVHESAVLGASFTTAPKVP